MAIHVIEDDKESFINISIAWRKSGEYDKYLTKKFLTIVKGIVYIIHFDEFEEALDDRSFIDYIVSNNYVEKVKIAITNTYVNIEERETITKRLIKKCELYTVSKNNLKKGKIK